MAAGLLVVLILAQISLGEAKVVGLHIFLGVIYVVLAVLFTSSVPAGIHPAPELMIDQPTGPDRCARASALTARLVSRTLISDSPSTMSATER